MPYSATSNDAYFRAASAYLAEPSASSEPSLWAELLTRHYGLSGTITTLSSEAESTFDVSLSDGRRLILKTSVRPEALESFLFQSSALIGVQEAKGFVSPEVIRTRNGAFMFEQEGICGYLQTRLHGTPLHQAHPTPDVLFQTGSALARLDQALSQLTLPSALRPVLWHIGCWPRLTTFEKYLPAGTIANLVDVAMSEYVKFVEPKISNLPWQITHNDPSPFNMMMTGQGIGFIDFGDGCCSPRIQDLVIAASHVVKDPSLPLGGAEHLIAGYASVIALSAEEASLLVGLMRARQSALILVNYWRAHLFPAEAQYITKNVSRAERGLTILSALSIEEGEAAVLKAVSSPRP
ncbi:MAG: phosphotransferase [Candidatus Acidiferrum sp.]